MVALHADAFPELNLPPASLDVQDRGGKAYVRDPLRRKWVRLTPEEWVRQHLVPFLTEDLGIPAGLIALEYAFRYQQQTRRADILVYDRAGKPLFMIECKKPSQPLSQATFDQVAQYNRVVKAPYLAISNGLTHYCCHIDHTAQAISFLPSFPSFDEMTTTR